MTAGSREDRLLGRVQNAVVIVIDVVGVGDGVAIRLAKDRDRARIDIGQCAAGTRVTVIIGRHRQRDAAGEVGCGCEDGLARSSRKIGIDGRGRAGERKTRRARSTDGHTA